VIVPHGVGRWVSGFYEPMPTTAFALGSGLFKFIAGHHLEAEG
jgi:hypothetical protein